MELIAFVLGVVAVVMVVGVKGRVSRLEEKIYGKPGPVSAPEIVRPPQAGAPLMPNIAPALASAPVPSAPSSPGAGERFAAWLKEDWLLKLGALLLLMGFGWLVSYAFINNWIGPMGRIALGLIAGAAILVLGFWRVQKYVHQGGIFMVLGSTVILITIVAGRELYGFFTPVSALGLAFLSAAFVALASVKYRVRSLAVSSLVLAMISPSLFVDGRTDYLLNFAYLFVIVLGSIWIVALTGWRVLTSVALVFVALHAMPYLAGVLPSDREVMLLFVYAFSAVFFVHNIIGILKSTAEKVSQEDLFTGAGTGLFLLGSIILLAKPEFQSLIISAWMVVFLVGAFAVFRVTGRREPFYVYAGVAIAMLGAATAAELDGAALVVAYTIESALIALVSLAVTKDVRIAERLSFLLVGPIILSGESVMASEWRTSIFHEHFFVLFVMVIAMMGVGLVLKDRSGDRKSVAGSAWTVIGSVYAYALLWLSLHAFFYGEEDTAVLVSLVIYTVIGLITYIRGRMHEEKGLRTYGAVLLSFVVGRLLLVDVWDMELVGRIITFFAVGTLLMTTAFIGRSKKSLTGVPPTSTN